MENIGSVNWELSYPRFQCFEVRIYDGMAAACLIAVDLVWGGHLSINCWWGSYEDITEKC